MLATVLIPNFNCERYLLDALRSVTAQSHRPIQLIVVDDGSMDDSRRIIREFADSATEAHVDYEWIFLELNRGKIGALNSVIPLIRGVVTCLLDADDYLFPDYLTLAVADLYKSRSEGSRLGFVYTDCELVDSRGNVLGRGRSTDFDPNLLELASYIPDCGVTMSESLKESFPYDESIRVGTKHHKWLKIVRCGTTGLYRPRLGFSYRLHAANISGIGNRLLKEGSLDGKDRLLSGYWPLSNGTQAARIP